MLETYRPPQPRLMSPTSTHQPNRWATRQHTRTDPLDCHTKGHAIERTLTVTV